MNWETSKDDWNEDYNWFLVDDGQIQYAFKTRHEANLYKKQGYLGFMLLTNLDNITNDTMLEPKEYSAWNNKIQTCLRKV